jgi:CSLREA domain-containing protein
MRPTILSRRTVLLLAVVGATLLALSAGVLTTEPLGAATSFTVDSVADDADASPGDGACATANRGCTLRAAIEEANLRTGPDAIAFDIPGKGVHTIQLGGQLPALEDTSGPTTIDGYTQPGSSPNTDPSVSNATITVQITSAPGAFAVSRGLYVTSSGNTVRGLALFKLKNPITLYGGDDNTVAGNFVGTDAAGDYAASGYVAAGDGVLMVHGARRNIIGGTSAADRNVVSGNARRGIVASGLRADYNRVINNIVGLGPKGDKRLANIKHGVDLNSGASQNVVGGAQPGERNVISGNGWTGVEISHLADTVENKVIRNFIGTDATGNGAPAYAYNGTQGVHLQDKVNNNEVTRNVIGNNRTEGVRIAQNAFNNLLQYNRIGVSLDGKTPIPNDDAGVTLGNNSDQNRIGPNNTIANNPVGVQITTEDSDFNTITLNSIFGNTQLGIDLRPIGSANPNDEGDADRGANEQLNFPVIGTATTLSVTGRACGGCTVEVFLADGGAGAYGEGKTFVGSATASGAGIFSVPVSGVANGRYVTATATDSAGNTSEFSPNKAAS